MRFPKKTPGEGKRRPQAWNHEKVPPGTSFLGWIAGEPHWVNVHHVGVSKPCFYDLTSGALECPWCPRKPRIDLIGYVPLYAENGKPTVVIVPEYHAETLQHMKLHDSVKVSRGKVRGDAIVISPSRWSEPYRPTCFARTVKADIEPWLIVFWKQAPLAEWWEKQPAPQPTCEVSPVTPKALPSEDPDEIKDPMLKAAWARTCAESRARRGGVPMIGDVVDAVPAAHRNGKPKPK